jgi:hypothetical protein
MPVRAGQRIEIHGLARTGAALTGGDGLLVYDSLGGRELGLRLAATSGWQEFTLRRVTTRDTSLSVTIELDGLGEALVDSLEVIVVDASERAANEEASRSGTASRLRNWFSSPR